MALSTAMAEHWKVEYMKEETFVRCCLAQAGEDWNQLVGNTKLVMGGLDLVDDFPCVHFIPSN